MLRFPFLLLLLISSGIAWGADFRGIDAGANAEYFVQAMVGQQFDSAAKTFDYSQSAFSGSRVGVAKNLEVLAQEMGGLTEARLVSSIPSGPTVMVEIAAPHPVSLEPQRDVFQVVIYETKTPNDGTLYYQIRLVRMDAGWRVLGLQMHVSANRVGAVEKVEKIIHLMKYGRPVALSMNVIAKFEVNS